MQTSTVRNLAALLQNVTVLVYDPDPPIAGIVRQVLTRLGFLNICITHDRDEALDYFMDNPVDFLITDFDRQPIENDMDLVTFIRTSPDSPNRTIPIIMLSGLTGEQDVLWARDAGITEFAAKPFTAKTLSERIIRIIENPRSFIITKRYVGPDRRFKANGAQSRQRRKQDKLAARKEHHQSLQQQAAAAAQNKDNKGIFGWLLGR